MGLSADAWAQIGTTLFNTGSQYYTNQLNRRNALADWNRQNLYNAPAQQMQRFKEAGLNPNLIYKQTNEAAPVRSTEYVAPQLGDFQGILSKSNQLEIQDQQLNNMQLQNEAIKAQIEKTKADALYVASNTNYKNLDILRLQGQLPGLVEGIQLRNQSMRAEIENRVADTNNKIAQLPILNVQKQRLEKEVERLYKSNKFIDLEKNQQLKIQNILESNLKVIGENLRRSGYGETINQELKLNMINKIQQELMNLRIGKDQDMTSDILGLIKSLF